VGPLLKLPQERKKKQTNISKLMRTKLLITSGQESAQENAKAFQKHGRRPSEYLYMD